MSGASGRLAQGLSRLPASPLGSFVFPVEMARPPRDEPPAILCRGARVGKAVSRAVRVLLHSLYSYQYLYVQTSYSCSRRCGSRVAEPQAWRASKHWENLTLKVLPLRPVVLNVVLTRLHRFVPRGSAP